MERYVVDASVILKWVLGKEQENGQDLALKLLDTWAAGIAELAAPSLWQYEVGNFLGRELKLEAIEKMNLLLDLRIQSVDLNNTIIERCFAWMEQHAVTFYDASYLAVAFEIKGILVTADEKFCKKMENVGRICLLGDLNLPQAGDQ
ncbi:MAG: type II toxin-antitoxin system VapC family toxin [Deltaproteobacteria bacterium]|nr:type II toxin-antitoxin system VapC family toxin [Deltaproteobacteria bacterium]MBW2072167.1 type II toxin-antitoxin system VapC family toxin [Deltaproteobacteria bacterium]